MPSMMIVMVMDMYLLIIDGKYATTPINGKYATTPIKSGGLLSLDNTDIT